jgi:hypothetical protein
VAYISLSLEGPFFVNLMVFPSVNEAVGREPGRCKCDHRDNTRLSLTGTR